MYKLELPKKWKIHNIFHTSLLEQDTKIEERVDKNATELDISNNDGVGYKVEAIWDSAVYARESKSDHWLGFYHLVSWKRYLEEEKT